MANMGRDFQIQGPCMVKVIGGQHLSGGPIGNLTELGLTSDQISVRVNSSHRDISPDEFADKPAELYWEMATCDVYMTLVHYDEVCLRVCMSESAVGGGEIFRTKVFKDLDDVWPYSQLKAAGTLMGNGLPRLASGNHFVGLNIASKERDPWRFFTAYLAERPVVYPLGTERSLVELHWRAIPYRGIYQPLTKTGDDPNYSMSMSEGVSKIAPVNAGTNNGPAWTPRIIQLPSVRVPVLDAEGKQTGTTAPLEQTYEVVREILSSGAGLYDHVLDI